MLTHKRLALIISPSNNQLGNSTMSKKSNAFLFRLNHFLMSKKMDVFLFRLNCFLFVTLWIFCAYAINK